MKILFTGGGTGGHFYPIIAIAESIIQKSAQEKLIPPSLYYMAADKYNPRALFDHEITFIEVPAGKLRRYFSLLNITDIFKTALGVVIAIFKMYSIYPDVVFGKGGYASFPALVAARILRIPVIIHESDSKPGRVNAWAAKFAKKIAISYPDAIQYFDKDKVAFTGNPIRKEISTPLENGAFEYLKLEEGIPVILILGGSQGSERINDAVIDSINKLTEKYQVIHQTGRKNLESVRTTMTVVMKDNPHQGRYRPMDYLNELSLRMAAGAASIVISRAGSTIFEIAAWAKPAILIPLSTAISHDQTSNAFAYARKGGCSVIEELNLSSNILASEIERLMNNPEEQARMKEAARGFARLDAADKIAQVILEIGLQHEA